MTFEAKLGCYSPSHSLAASIFKQFCFHEHRASLLIYLLDIFDLTRQGRTREYRKGP
jgi:hypothetical protein